MFCRLWESAVAHFIVNGTAYLFRLVSTPTNFLKPFSGISGLLRLLSTSLRTPCSLLFVRTLLTLFVSVDVLTLLESLVCGRYGMFCIGGVYGTLWVYPPFSTDSSNDGALRSSSPQTTTYHPTFSSGANLSRNSIMLPHCSFDTPFPRTSSMSRPSLISWTMSVTYACGCETTDMSLGSYCSIKRRFGRLLVMSGYSSSRFSRSATVVPGATSHSAAASSRF